MIALMMSALLTTAALQSDPARRGACALLSDEEIRAVQGAQVVGRKAGETSVKALDVGQCVFTAREFAQSISLTVMTGDTRAYWEATFHKRPPAEVPASTAGPTRVKKKSPPRAVAGTGDEAFWTGDDRAGSLYVLSGRTILRISIGGVADEAERMKRSETLAQHALGRLR